MPELWTGRTVCGLSETLTTTLRFLFNKSGPSTVHPYMKRITLYNFLPMRILFLLAFLWSVGSVQALAQNPPSSEYATAADSDPEARALLDKLHAKYEGLGPLRADFRLELEFAEQPKEVQQGVLIRAGERYRVSMGDRDVLSDGQALYLILHRNKEVQINDIPEEGEAQGSFSPQAILNLHQSDQFVYVMGGLVSRNGQALQQIEFKPLDPYADYSKLRMEVDPRANELVSATAFGKDGSRYILILDKIGSAELPEGFFTFNEADYPDYYVEDLRQ